MATNNPHKQLAMSALMSPPEATPYDRFPTAELPSSSPSSTDSRKKSSIGAKLQFLSPPVSPDTPTTAGPSSSPTTFDSRIRDPILYPPTTAESDNTPQPPLFAPSPQPHPKTPTHTPHDRLVDQHISRAHRKHLFHATSPPDRSDYILAIEFRSQVMRQCARDPGAWLARERQYLIDASRIRAAAASSRTLSRVGVATAGAAEAAREAETGQDSDAGRAESEPQHGDEHEGGQGVPSPPRPVPRHRGAAEAQRAQGRVEGGAAGSVCGSAPGAAGPGGGVACGEPAARLRDVLD
ncbi:hypothetical protein V498_03997, partial [Pseudogymnoascus sp. VKM F-4517 (FW-2822)]